MDGGDGNQQPGGGAAILRPSEMTPRERGHGAPTVSLVTSKLGSASLLNGITEFDPGGSIEPHSHNCEESVMVMEGHVVVTIDGTGHVLGPTDTTLIPAGIPHHFRNSSSSEGARIFWTYASIDATRNLADGSVRRIDEERLSGGKI